MKKMWVKRENMYYKPFYKQKLKMSLVLVVLMALIFFSYQIFCLTQISKSSHSFTTHNDFPDYNHLRGIHTDTKELYKPSLKFKCLSEDIIISYDKVNDNYCDCTKDGSDEPSTNACTNGKFYCTHSMSSIPSSRVNDGICDCCDNSDEWLNVPSPIKHLPVNCKYSCR